MYYILETEGSDYETYDENVVKFSESKEELEIICTELQNNYNKDYDNWKLAKSYYAKLKEIVSTEIKYNVDGKTCLNSLDDYYTNKFQEKFPISEEIRKFLYFKNDNKTVRGVLYEIRKYSYKVKEVMSAKY